MDDLRSLTSVGFVLHRLSLRSSPSTDYSGGPALPTMPQTAITRAGNGSESRRRTVGSNTEVRRAMNKPWQTVKLFGVLRSDLMATGFHDRIESESSRAVETSACPEHDQCMA